MTILIVIVYLALAACIESHTTSVPSEPPVYEWIGPGSVPSLEQLALSQSLCFQEAELLNPHGEPGIVRENRKAHVKLCMRKEGWGEKAVK